MPGTSVIGHIAYTGILNYWQVIGQPLNILNPPHDIPIVDSHVAVVVDCFS